MALLLLQHVLVLRELVVYATLADVGPTGQLGVADFFRRDLIIDFGASASLHAIDLQRSLDVIHDSRLSCRHRVQIIDFSQLLAPVCLAALYISIIFLIVWIIRLLIFACV